MGLVKDFSSLLPLPGYFSFIFSKYPHPCSLVPPWFSWPSSRWPWLQVSIAWSCSHLQPQCIQHFSILILWPKYFTPLFSRVLTSLPMPFRLLIPAFKSSINSPASSVSKIPCAWCLPLSYQHLQLFALQPGLQTPKLWINVVLCLIPPVPGVLGNTGENYVVTWTDANKNIRS